MVFTHQDFFALKARSQEKTSENEALEPEKPCPEPLQTLQNRAWSGRRRIKNDQKQQQTQQVVQNAPKKCPRVKNSAILGAQQA